MAIPSVTATPVNNSGQTSAPPPARAQAPAEATPKPAPANANANSNTEAPSRSRVGRAIDSINQRLAETGADLRFSMDEDSGKLIVRVVDTATKEVIRQIPSEESLAISQSIEKLQGLLVKQKA